MLQNKQQLRTWAEAQRNKLDMNNLSAALISKLRNLKDYEKAKNIMIFYPLKKEVNLLELMNDNDKNFYLPKIIGREIVCCPYSKGEELCSSRFNTKEPYTEAVDKDIIDLIIVPALAVDENNYRLGYGGGFYDRFLVDTKCKKIACIPKQLIIKTIFPEKTDIAVDFVISA